MLNYERHFWSTISTNKLCINQFLSCWLIFKDIVENSQLQTIELQLKYCALSSLSRQENKPDEKPRVSENHSRGRTWIRQMVYGEQLRVGEATHRLGNFKIVAPPAALICLRITKELLECRFLDATPRQYGSGALRQVHCGPYTEKHCWGLTASSLLSGNAAESCPCPTGILFFICPEIRRQKHTVPWEGHLAD